MTDIHPTPLAQFTTTGECQVTLSRYDDGGVLAWFKVDHGEVAYRLDGEKRTSVQSASVLFDPASLASLREAITEHVWVNIAREREGEISLQCLCGLAWKHLPLKIGENVDLPGCPAASEEV